MPRPNLPRGPVLATLVLFAAIAGAAGVAGLAAADDHTDVSPDDPEPGAATNHSWVTHVDAGVDNTTDVVTLYYGETGADLHRVGTADASVSIDGNDVAVQFVSTDENGQVLHLDLAQGVAVNGSESVSVSLENDSVTNPTSAGNYDTEIVLGNSSGAFYGDVTSLSISETGSIRGTISDGNGSGLGDVGVSLYSPEWGSSGYNKTGPDGTYHIQDVPAGDHYVTATRDGYTQNQSKHTVRADETTDVNFTLVDAGTIDGQVLSTESNDGVSGVEVTVFENGTDTRVTSSRTDDAGNYSFDLAPGSYDVAATSLTYSNNQVTNVTIGVDETAVEDVYVVPHDTGTVDGTVTDAADNSLEDGFVEVFTRDGRHVTTALVDENDTYSKELPTGNYDLLAHTGSATYGDEWERNVSVDVNQTTTNHYALQEQAVLRGQVTSQDDTPVSNADVGVLDDGAWVDGARTDSSGNYSVGVPNGSYELEVRADGYHRRTIDPVNVTVGNPTTRDVDLVEQATGTLSGTVENASGAGIEDATVHLFRDHEWITSTKTNSNGTYSVPAGTGTYTVEVQTDAYGRQRYAGVEVREDETTVRDVTLVEPAVVEGTVLDDADQPVEDGMILANGPVRGFSETDASGNYTLTLPPGEYSITVFTRSEEVAEQSYTLDLTSGESETQDVSVVKPEVTNESIDVVANKSGVDEANLSVNTMMGPGVLLVRAHDARTTPTSDQPYGIEHLGVGENTEFEISMTVAGYEPETLLWGTRGVDWTVNDTDDSDVYNVTVRTKAVHLEAIDPRKTAIGPIQGRDYRQIDWPTGENDTADAGFNQTVYFGLFDDSMLPGDALGKLSGMTISTNAQAFSRPRFVDDSLEVYVAGPSTTVAGNQHEGFYEAFIPQSQLDDWGVENPEEDLQALYKGESKNFEVTEPDDGSGAWIHLDITYSDGVVEVSPAEDQDDGDDGSGIGGFPAPPSDGDDQDDSTDQDAADDETDDDSSNQEEEATDDETEETDDGTGAADDETEGADDASDEPESDETPGFGLGVALAALFGALALRYSSDPEQ